MSATELFTAITSGDTARVQQLIAAEPHLASARDTSGVSAVTTALYHRKKEIADLLVAAGASIDIFEAAMLGDQAKVESHLRDHPALARARSADGGTALHFACFFGHPEIAKLLIERGSDLRAVAEKFGNVQPLHSAVASRVHATIELLLLNGAPVNAKQQQGYTALHSAAHHGDMRLAKLLLQYGADPLQKLDDGQTPIDMAQKAGHLELAAMLRANTE